MLDRDLTAANKTGFETVGLGIKGMRTAITLHSADRRRKSWTMVTGTGFNRGRSRSGGFPRFDHAGAAGGGIAGMAVPSPGQPRSAADPGTPPIRSSNEEAQ